MRRVQVLVSEEQLALLRRRSAAGLGDLSENHDRYLDETIPG